MKNAKSHISSRVIDRPWLTLHYPSFSRITFFA
jgi:hypothetical protein